MENIQLEDLVTRDNVKILALVGKAKKPASWDAPNNWRVTLVRKGKRLSVDFYGGSAVKEVSAAAVLSSLCLDSSVANDSFENFCADLGYDADSRNALKNYKACNTIGVKLRKFLGDSFDEYCQAEH